MKTLDLLTRFVKVDTRAYSGTDESLQRQSLHWQEDLIEQVLVLLPWMSFNDGKAGIRRLNDGSHLVTIPATPGCEGMTHAAFVVHVDTYPGLPGAAEPIVHQYAGGDIVLPLEGTVIAAADLAGLEGRTIVTASGDSLLGGDDKAGNAILIAAINRVVEEGIPHGPLSLLLCTNEEIGLFGATDLPQKVVDSWDICWTLDGLEAGTIDVGCFNGSEVVATYVGHDAHVGIAGDQVKPAHYAACELVAKSADAFRLPWQSSDDQPFLYATEILGGKCGGCSVKFRPRSFKRGYLDEYATDLRIMAQAIADKYGVELHMNDPKLLYVNTAEAIEAKARWDIKQVRKIMQRAGLAPICRQVRGGSDGGMLNLKYPQLPAPDLGIGVRNLHQKTEFVVVEEMEKMVDVVVGLIAAYATRPTQK
jgi:tripeptide aminopeptidase